MSIAAVPAVAHVTATRAVSAANSIKPNKINMLDCNGWSPKYSSVKPFFKGNCVDPHGKLVKGSAIKGLYKGGWSRFEDNGHYVGHDEPDVKFISHSANSGNTFTYFMKMPKDPAAPATNSGSVVHYAQLSVAPWFGLPMCDPLSYPESTSGCTPDSDSNSGSITDPLAANSAFMELQFYAPGFAPFADFSSCSATQWCAAMTIDSLESEFNFANLNVNCEEPVNFAFLQKNGVPTGPPSPQLANGHTFLPNSHTLKINSGDTIKLAITDPANGFTATITDLTTHQTGWITASKHNGFADTMNNPSCTGVPHTFHAEYATAAQQNQVPWAALEGGVLMQQEIGHSEVCTSLANKDPINEGSLIKDPKVWQTCISKSEGGKKDLGEGPCNFSTGVCKGAKTEGVHGPVACPTNNFGSGALCEFSDGICLPQGSRTVHINGHAITEHSQVNWCLQNQTQNGDLDFDGLSYQKDWPDGSPNHPTSFRYVGPFDQAGNSYPSIQFQTNAPGSEFLCNVSTGHNCDVPPLGANFYPFWTITNKQGLGHGLFPANACAWNFGNVIPGITTRTMGRDHEYGAPDLARYGGSSLSPVLNNPEINTGKGCTALAAP